MLAFSPSNRSAVINVLPIAVYAAAINLTTGVIYALGEDCESRVAQVVSISPPYTSAGVKQIAAVSLDHINYPSQAVLSGSALIVPYIRNDANARAGSDFLAIDVNTGANYTVRKVACACV